MKEKALSNYLPRLISEVSIVSLLVFIIGCATPTTRYAKIDSAEAELEAKKQRGIALEAWIEDYNRLADVAYRLLTKSTPLCGEKTTYRIGVFAINKYMLPEKMREAANTIYKVSDELKVLHITEGSPAYQAGFKQNDIIATVGASHVSHSKHAIKEFSEMIKAAADEKSLITVKVSRNRIDNFLYVKPDRICDYGILLTDDEQIKAFADGNNVIITRGLMRYTKDNNELALVVSHELAHNIMGHMKAKKQNYALGSIFDIIAGGFGVYTQGTFGKMAAQSYSKEFEAEADYVGLYLMALAGLDIDNTPNFWRRMAAAKPGSIEYSKTHPSTPQRFIALEKTVQEIKQKIASKLPLKPEMQKDKELPLATEPVKKEHQLQPDRTTPVSPAYTENISQKEDIQNISETDDKQKLKPVKQSVSPIHMDNISQKENIQIISDRDKIVEEQINKGFELIEMRQYKDALVYFTAATYRDPTNANAQFGIGLSYLKLGDNEVATNINLIDQAISAFKEALSFQPNDPKIHYNLGLCYLALDNKNAARMEYDTLKNLDNGLANQLLSKIKYYKKR